MVKVDLAKVNLGNNFIIHVENNRRRVADD